jgi:hypothetical protein
MWHWAVMFTVVVGLTGCSGSNYGKYEKGTQPISSSPPAVTPQKGNPPPGSENNAAPHKAGGPIPGKPGAGKPGKK